MNHMNRIFNRDFRACISPFFNIRGRIGAACTAVLLGFAATLTFAGGAVAQNDDALRKLDDARAALSSLSFDALIQTPKPGDRWSRIEMSFVYKAPNQYRSVIEMGIEGDVITVSDGDHLWTHSTRTGNVYRQSYELAIRRLRSSGPADLITALTTPEIPLSDLFDVMNVEQVTDGIVLTLKPTKSVPHYDRLILKLNKQGTTPISAETFKRSRTIAKVTFKTFRKNPKVSTDQFTFTPPKGSELIELK